MKTVIRLYILPLMLLAVLALSVASCARMGNPDGGWFDEKPPQIVRCTPADRATGVNSKRVVIEFDEYIKLESASEKVTISPPQVEQAEIKTTGKGIRIDLKDSLKANTTYTIDFSDAISDNNEGNPLGNYTYCFSTGDEIDTMEVSGYVVNAEDLEPIKGMLVGLYSNLEDSVFRTDPMLRVARTDGNGHFVIKGVAQGEYRVYGLEDTDNDYKFSQKAERLAFNHDIIVPSSKPDIRQDTLWADTLHISDIKRVPYTHFLPDDICLRAFTHEITDRYFVKAERKEPEHITLYFSYGSDELPEVRGLNFDSDEAFVVESSAKRDTITYWLRSQDLVDQDTLRAELRYLMTDSLGELAYQTDTLEFMPKVSFEKRQKQAEEKRKEWQKQQDKKRKKGATDVEEEMPAEALEPKYEIPQDMSPVKNVRLVMPAPLASFDTLALHLYQKVDTLWEDRPLLVNTEGMPPRTYELQSEWELGQEYRLDVDSAAFRDIYGHVSMAAKKSIKLAAEETFGTLFVEINGLDVSRDSTVFVNLLSRNTVVACQPVIQRTAQFYYTKPGEYFLSYFVDENRNGKWDTGDYDRDLQPEPVYFHPEKVECKAKWDITIGVNPNTRPLYRQKPGEIVQQKGEKKKAPRNQNMQRAQKLGIQYIPK